MKISCCTQAQSHPLLNPVKTVLCAEMIHNKQLYCLSTLLYENFFQGFFFLRSTKNFLSWLGRHLVHNQAATQVQVWLNHRDEFQINFTSQKQELLPPYRCCSGGEKKKYNPSSVCYNESQKAHDAPQKPEPKKQCGRTLVPSLENTA